MKVIFNGATHDVIANLEDSLLELQLVLSEQFGLTPPYQKLVFKGKKLNVDVANETLSRLGLSQSSKLQLLGTTESDVAALKLFEEQMERRRHIIATRATGKISSTRNGSSSFATLRNLPTIRFHAVTPLPEDPTTPHLAKRQDMLNRLANDAGILAIMKKRDLSVGELTELHPLRTAVNLMGLNKNAGQQILLKILTDDLSGTRSFNYVRRVLIHELTHNKFGPHDNDFLALDSEMAKEVKATHDAQRQNTGHRLGGEIHGDQYDPEEAAQASLTLLNHGDSWTDHSSSAGNVLGSGDSSLVNSGSLIDRRREAADAAERRRQRQ